MVRRTLLGTVMLVMLAAFARADEAGSAEPEEEVPAPPDPMAYAEDVIVLGDDNFTATVDAEELMLVEFYAPWCGHCKALAPEYAKAATQLKADNIKLAKVDCTTQSSTCNKFDVQGYPTVKVFRKGEAHDYSSGRDAEKIVSYMKKQALPAVSQVNVGNFDEFKETDEVVIIGFFDEKSQSEFNMFNDVANKLRDSYVFGASAQPELLEKVNVKAPTVILYKKFDEGMDKHTGTFDEETLQEFIKVNSIPLMAEIGPQNYASYVDSGVPLAYIFYADKEQRTTVGNQVQPVAKEFKGKVNFVYIDAQQFGSHAENLNLKQEWPAFGIQKPKEGLKYPFNQSHEITTETIREFVVKFHKGDIEPSIKSQPIPEKNDDPVFTLVADSFEENVYKNKDVDVLVEFYAQWCGHCKKLAPTYDKLGEKYAAFKDKILIAKMDAIENDLPPRVPFQVEGFPTIKLFKAGEEKEIVEYKGDRSLEDFVKFLKDNAVNKVDVDGTDEKTDSKVADNKTEKKTEKKEEKTEHDEL